MDVVEGVSDWVINWLETLLRVCSIDCSCAVMGLRAMVSFRRAAVCSTRVLVVVLGARLASLFVALWAYRAVVMSLVWAAAVRIG